MSSHFFAQSRLGVKFLGTIKTRSGEKRDASSWSAATALRALIGPAYRLAHHSMHAVSGAVLPPYTRLLRAFVNGLYKKGTVYLAKVGDSRVQTPLPEMGITSGIAGSAGEGKTAASKWELISETLPESASSALDIGSNNGFFTLRLASRGLFTVGVEPNEGLLRLAQLAAIETKAVNAAFSLTPVTPESVSRLPKADVTLLLSVMHYWVQDHGRSVAEEMLRTIWDKTHSCMYFEVPNPTENTKMASHLAFMGSTEPECRAFLDAMLQNLGSAEVTLLGYLPTDFRGDERRHLFMVKRR